MVPMYAARVEHLTHHETVTALCAACGHVAEVSGNGLAALPHRTLTKGWPRVPLRRRPRGRMIVEEPTIELA